MVTKKTSSKKITPTPAPTLATVIMVYMKSSSHWYALVQPEIVTIDGLKFVAGKQVTGKIGHRMEGKRTLIPFDHVASIIEFAAEEDLWSEPQPRHIPAPPAPKSAILTSHEQEDNIGNGDAQGQKHAFRNDRHRHGKQRFRHRH